MDQRETSGTMVPKRVEGRLGFRVKGIILRYGAALLFAKGLRLTLLRRPSAIISTIIMSL